MQFINAKAAIDPKGPPAFCVERAPWYKPSPDTALARGFVSHIHPRGFVAHSPNTLINPHVNHKSSYVMLNNSLKVFPELPGTCRCSAI